ncbi:cytochrome c-type biogenesis protein [Rheinheimera sp.]|uniref:cytochrome c-type biogenesis protein n=1 Tax=Rheinheimera sp. TaxID=1869214 RepID=UPI003D26FECB
MSRRLNVAAAVLCALLCAGFASAVGAAEDLVQFESTEQQQLYRQLTAELRCPKCQNQNIADSNAVVAVDMRNKTLELVRQGQTHDQVIDFMKQRYGDFVHYQPPFQLSTIWLWLLPILAVLSLAFTVFRRSKSSQTAEAPEAETAGLDAELQAMIDAASAKSKE